MEYVLTGLPEYTALTTVINDFATLSNPSMRQVEGYTNALERFSQKEYHYIEDQVVEELKSFQLADYGSRIFSSLSGGEKRLVEVVKIMHAKADLALIDEPTNFMDYVAKEKFIDWMKSAPEAILVITHDRDVLKEVDRIIEIKDGEVTSYDGNYEFYLRENASRTGAAMTSYEIVERRKENLKAKIIDYKRLKDKTQHVSSTVKQFKRLEQNAIAELAKLEKTERPSFWIDSGSIQQLNYRDSDRYGKYKAKNVRIGLDSGENKSKRVIVKAEDLSIGYETPLFSGKNFELKEGGILEIRGRNGAGKTTLIKAILGNSNVQTFSGSISRDLTIRVGIYEQEVGRAYFNLPLEVAIERTYLDRKLSISTKKIRQLLADYLFTEQDRITEVKKLSGGQKARFQIISMLANDPQLLILDEPTSHLDLPSIEELESALAKYSGAILYISHDGYFRSHIDGEVLVI